MTPYEALAAFYVAVATPESISPSRKRASQPHRGISGSTGADLLSGTPVQVALNTPALTTPRGRRVGASK